MIHRYNLGWINRPLMDRPLMDRPLMDRPLMDRPLMDRPLMDRPLMDRPLMDRPLIDRQGIGHDSEGVSAVSTNQRFYASVFNPLEFQFVLTRGCGGTGVAILMLIRQIGKLWGHEAPRRRSRRVRRPASSVDDRPRVGIDPAVRSLPQRSLRRRRSRPISPLKSLLQRAVLSLSPPTVSAPRSPQSRQPGAVPLPSTRPAPPPSPASPQGGQLGSLPEGRRDRSSGMPPVRRDRRSPTQARSIRLGQGKPEPTGLGQGGTGTPRRRRRTLPPWVYGVRLVMIGVGLSAIAGTVMIAFDPARRVSPTPIAAQSGTVVDNALVSNTPETVAMMATDASRHRFQLQREIRPLQQKLQTLIQAQKGLSARVLIADLDTGDYAHWNKEEPSIAASTIKLPVLVAFFQAVDAQRVRLDDPLTLRQELVGSGAGEMQYQKPGKQYSAIETATKMIAISDNTATNLILDHLGGAESLNEEFRQWGLRDTVIRDWLPDLAGTNTISPQDAVELLVMLNEGQLVSLRSRDRLFSILRSTANRSLIPAGTGREASIAHKTGTLAVVLADVGIVDLPNGRRYAIAAIVQRPRNDGRAQVLIRQIAQAAYEHFKNAAPAP